PDRFYYGEGDYDSLRIGGLVFAGVLFFLGINIPNASPGHADTQQPPQHTPQHPTTPPRHPQHPTTPPTHTPTTPRHPCNTPQHPHDTPTTL
uniref:FXYD domain-containing ion transport regulator n=1 Tax=Dromaius novaehollandiae TaxID=8790 RepID=A0A8C4J3K6_DRONO